MLAALPALRSDRGVRHVRAPPRKSIARSLFAVGDELDPVICGTGLQYHPLKYMGARVRAAEVQQNEREMGVRQIFNRLSYMVWKG